MASKIFQTENQPSQTPTRIEYIELKREDASSKKTVLKKNREIAHYFTANLETNF